MNRLLTAFAILLLTATASFALEKVEPIQETIGYVAKESKLANGGAARMVEEWGQLKPMLTDLTEFPVNFKTESVVYCAMPSQFDGGSYAPQLTIAQDQGVLKVTCKAEWPEIFMEKTNTRRYAIAKIPRFDGPIEIMFAVIGPEFAPFAPLFQPINIPPLAEYPIFGPAGTTADFLPVDKPAHITPGEDP